MTRSNILAMGIALLGLVGLFSAFYWHFNLEKRLPPRKEVPSMAAAWQEASNYIAKHGGVPVRILGTGSMAPYIPPAKEGEDPRAVIVAIVIMRFGAVYSDIQRGDLVGYHPDWDNKEFVFHQAAKNTPEGWIMTGLNNRDYESKWRVTNKNFVGIVAYTIIPQL